MKKVFRQWTALLMALVLCVQMLPLGVFAQETEPSQPETLPVEIVQETVQETTAAATDAAPTETDAAETTEAAGETTEATEVTQSTEVTETTVATEPAETTEETTPVETEETVPEETEETVPEETEEPEITDGVPEENPEYDNQDVQDALAEFLAGLADKTPQAKQEIIRYTVLVLDTSGSMSGTPMTVAKQAAVKFCQSVLKAGGTNYVALVSLNSSASVRCTFTDNMDTLTTSINGTYANGGTNTNQALRKAGELLDGVSGNGSAKVIKNIVVCSDGQPESGETSTSGRYNYDDHSTSYKYANVAYETASAIKEKGYYIYSLGFFHRLQGNSLVFCQRFMKDIASEDKYYEVVDVEDLEFVFGEISAEITVEPYGFKFAGFLKPNKDVGKLCYYSDGYFLNDARIYDPHLATMSLCFELTTWSRNVKEESDWTTDVSKAVTGKMAWQNAYDLLVGRDDEEDGYENGLGFTDFYVNEYWENEPQKDSIGLVIAQKKLAYQDVTLVAVGVRGGGYGQEWASNFTVGKTGEHTGFMQAKNHVLEKLKEYIADHQITGEIKVWLVGYSRAGCVANMVGGELVKNPKLGSGTTVAQKDLYVYTFEAPMGTLKSYTNGNYKNIHNIINLNDLVPLVAPSSWGFARYNTDKYIPSAKLSSNFEEEYEEKMLSFYERFEGDTTYKVREYVTQYDIDVDLGNLFKKGASIIEKTPRKVPTEVVLTETASFLFDGLIGDRSTYYYNLQAGVREIAALANGGELADLLTRNNILPETFLQKFLNELTLERLFEIVSPMFAFSLDGYDDRKDKVKENIEDFVKDVLGDSDLWGTVLFIADLPDTLSEILWNFLETVLDELFSGNYKSLVSVYNGITLFVEDRVFPAHYPELTLSWMMSQDSYYEECQSDFSCTNFRIVHINCPVDVRVYDNATGNLVAAILNDEPQEVDGSSIISYMSLDGEKIVILPSDGDYRMDIKATGDGTLSYTVDEYDLTGNANTRIVGYFEVDITAGDNLTAYAPALSETEQESAIPNGSSADYALYDGGNALTPSRVVTGDAAAEAQYTVKVSANNDFGMVSGGGTYNLGSYALVEAFPMAGGQFLGWYENGNLVSQETEYRYVVTRDTELVAHFSEVQMYTLTVVADGDGRVSNSQVMLPAGSQIQLEAIPDEVDGFSGWSAPAGTFEDPLSETTWYTMPAQDVTVTASFRTDVSLDIRQEYIALEKGQRAALDVVATPAEIEDSLIWSVEPGGESVISVDNSGNVTAKAEGTAYVLATITDGRAVRSDRCRVDVSEPLVIDGVQLSTQKLNVELLSTDYSQLGILLRLPQNYSVKSDTAGAAPEKRSVAITDARFTDSAMEQLFSLIPVDDRTVALVPTDYAVQNPGSVSAKYTGTVTVTVKGEEYTSEALTLTVKKTKPKLKATVESFNSYYPGQTRPINVTGADMTEVKLNTNVRNPIPEWLELSDGVLRLTDRAPSKSVSGKVQLLIQTRQWRTPVAVSVSVKNTYKPLALKLQRSRINLNAGIGDTAILTLTHNLPGYTPEQFSYRILNSQKVDVTASNLLAVTFEEGAVRIETTGTTPVDEVLRLYISADGSKEVQLQINTVGNVPTAKLKTSGSIDLSFPENPMVFTGEYKNYAGGKLSGYVCTIIAEDKQHVQTDVTNLFSVNWDGGSIFTVYAGEGAQLDPTCKYTLNMKLVLANGTSVDCTSALKVKRTDIRVKLTPSSVVLNLRLEDKAEVSVVSAHKNYVITQPVWSLMDGSGKNAADGSLNVRWSGGKLFLETNDATQYGKTYKLLVSAYAGAPAAALKITVPAEGKSAVTSSLRVYGSLDPIRDASTLTLTATYKNAAVKGRRTETLEISTRDGQNVSDLFRIGRDTEGNFLLTKAVGEALDPAQKYSARLVTTFSNGDTVYSKPVQLKVKQGSAKMALELEKNVLYTSDSRSRVEFTLVTKDSALNDVARVEIKDRKLAQMLAVHGYGDGTFAIGFANEMVDRSLISEKNLSKTLTLNVYLEGNAGTKPNTTVKLPLQFAKYVAPSGNNNVCTLKIGVTNGDYIEETSSISTQDQSCLLTGTVTDGLVNRVTAKYHSYDGVSKDGQITGTKQWSVEIPLEIGTNTVTITAYDNNNRSVTKEIYINRTNTEVTYSDTVKVADEEDYHRLEEDFVACWVDDNQTADERDDSIVILAKENALLLSQIEDGLLEQGDVYMIPQNDVFVTGFTAVYENHRGHSGSEDYPLSEYPDSAYEEIVFSYPEFADLFDGDISLDFSQGVDRDDPIAFAMMADGTPIVLQEGTQPVHQYSSSAASTRDSYPKPGWQPQELAKNALPTAVYKIDQYNRLNLTLNWDDTVIYDHDGVKNEGALDYGQVKLSGDVGIKNLQYTGGLEWHPNFIPWELDLLPQQLISKLNYGFGGSLTVKGDASVSTTELIKALNSGFENKAEFWGMSVSGVSSLKNKWVLGVVGLNLNPPSVTYGTTIKGQAALSTLCPSLILVVFIDVDGNVTVEGALSFGYETKVEKGFNIQKNGYTGSYGSQNQNRSDKHYNIGFDRTLDIYDKNDGNFTLTFGGKVEATLDLGVGVGGGLMIGGVCPAMMDGEIFYRASGLVEGELQFLPEFEANGYASLYHGIGAQADLSAKLFVETGIGDAGFDVNKHFEHMFWEETKSTACLEGTVYISDDDGDNSNNAVISGASVKITNSDTGRTWTTTTDNSGKYRFTSIPDGQYKLEVEKQGFDPYVNKKVIFSKKLKHDVFLNQQAVEDGICSLQGKITIADDDTDQTNNLPLGGATVYVIRRDGRYSASATTGTDGTYMLNNLPAGVYNITISKTGYITIKAEVSIADNVQNYYNAMIEAVSEDYTGVGSASGVVYDAVTGRTVANLTLRVRSGINVTEGTIVATTKTNSQGQYTFTDLPAGNYTVEIVDQRTLSNEEERYFTSTFAIKVLGNKSIPNQNGHVTNGLAADQLRIVLRWGSQPSDLDSHIVGPTANGGSFHVFYNAKTHYESSVLMTDLDLDDRSSYGPETTTIYQPVSGDYVFLVHDYSNRNKTSSSALANSGAYVEVYLGTSAVAAYTFYVPNNNGTLWTVFSYDSDTGIITPINTMSYQSNASAVGSQYYSTREIMRTDFEKKDYEKD